MSQPTHPERITPPQVLATAKAFVDALVADLAEGFGRQRGGIRSRLRKLGLSKPG